MSGEQNFNLAWVVPTFLILSCPALAKYGDGIAIGGSDSPVIDGLARERLECLQSKLRPGRPGDLGNPPGGCYLVDDERGFYGELTEQFCKHPQEFCARTKRGREPRFVSSQCYPGSIEGADPSTIISEPKLDRGVGRMIAAAWGCKDSLAIRGEPPRPVLSYRCDRSRMPAKLSCDWKPGLGDLAQPGAFVAGADPLQQTQAILRVFSDRMTEEGGACVIDYHLLNSVIPFPAPTPGESFEKYSARLSPADKERLSQGIELQRNDSERSLAAAARLARSKSADSFRTFTRMALSEGRGEKLKSMMELAKRGMRAYLLGLKPPAPAFVVERVLKTELMDVDALMGKKSAKEEEEAMKSLETSCFNTSNNPKIIDGCGGYGAYNQGHVHPHHGRVMFCPALLLAQANTNPNSMMVTLLHELGHSIDTCALGNLQTAVLQTNPTDASACAKPAPIDSALPPGTPARKEFDEYVGRMNGPGGVADCLTQSPPVLPLPYRRPGSPELKAWLEKVLEGEAKNSGLQGAALEEFIQGRRKHYLKVNQATTARPAVRARGVLDTDDVGMLLKLGWPTCTLDKLLPPGPLAHCWLGHWTPEGTPFTEMFNSLAADQTGEASADMLAAGALPFALSLGPKGEGDPGCGGAEAPKPFCQSTSAKSDPNLADLGVDEKRAELLTMLGSTTCWTGSGALNDAHPDAETRISVFSSSETIRAQIGCQPPQAPPVSSEHPAGSCAARLSAKKGKGN